MFFVVVLRVLGCGMGLRLWVSVLRIRLCRVQFKGLTLRSGLGELVLVEKESRILRVGVA